MTQSELFEPDYIVRVTGLSPILCNSEDEVWEAIGKGSIGSLYTVESPTGKDVSDFIPF